MAELFASGRVVDLVIGFAILEGLILAIVNLRTKRGLSLPETVALLLPGLLLMLALRAALVGASWMWIAACLLLALVAHLVDLRRRWPRN